MRVKMKLTAKERKAGLDLRNFEVVKKKPTVRRPRPVMVKYEVTIVREVEHRAVIEVEAESEDVAKQMAETIADNGNPYSNRWVEGDCLSQNIKVKVIS